MFDLKTSYFADLKERPVAPGASITEEGQLCVYVDGGAGEMAVQPCTTGAGQALAGFAITDAMKKLTDVVVETVTVPASAPYTSGSTRATASTTGVLTLDDASASGEYAVALTNGVVTFHSAQAGETVTVQYRYTLTMQESLSRFHERSVNNRAQDYFATVTVGCHEGEIFTSMYDTSAAYTVGASIYVAAAGKVSSAVSGAPIGFVSKVPSTGDGLLGVKFDLPLKS
jgi:hypothetical protein